MQNDPSCDFIAEALEGDIFEWHFVIRGPPETEFEGGIYHGRILLPAEYPFKPPSFMMLTPSGRFETGVKICLSISSHHPEHWQPSWSVRTALTALIAFMPSPGAGALGSLDFSKDERRAMAIKARKEAPTFGSAERQLFIEEMHQRMIQRVATAATANAPNSADHIAASHEAQQQQQQESNAECSGSVVSPASVQVTQPTAAGSPEAKGSQSSQPAHGTSSPAATLEVSPEQQQQQSTIVQPAYPVPQATRITHADSADHGLTLLAIALSVGIAAILLRKVLAAFDASDFESMFS